jgi:hypothetical protein
MIPLLKSHPFQFTILHPEAETLQNAIRKAWNHRVFFSSYKQENSKCSRAFRISNPKPTQIHRILCPDLISLSSIGFLDTGGIEDLSRHVRVHPIALKYEFIVIKSMLHSKKISDVIQCLSE